MRLAMKMKALLGAVVTGSAAIGLAGDASAADDTLKVYLMIGQSNMEGQAYAYHIPQTGPGTWNVPTIQDMIDRPATLAALPDSVFTFADNFSSDWLNDRNDVWGVHYRSDNGANLPVKNGTTTPVGGWDTGVQPLQPGFGLANSPFAGLFGAELAMGQRLGDAMNSPVLLFKSSKGGTDLAYNWRPPSAVADRGGSVGAHYTNTINQFLAQLDALDADLGDDGLLNNYNNATGYEVAGIVWLQGWNTTNGSQAHYSTAQKIAEYADNLEDLVEDIRAADARIPGDVPAIIVESSDQNVSLNAERQAGVDLLNADNPGSAVFIETNGLKGVNYSGDGVTNVNGDPYNNGWGFHFHARAENFLEIGWKVGGAVIDNGFTGSEVIPGPIPADLDGDGDVDGVDLSAFFGYFNGPGGGTPADPDADLDSDGDVDGVDLSEAFSAFTGPLAPVQVPEPGSLALLALGGLVAVRRRR